MASDAGQTTPRCQNPIVDLFQQPRDRRHNCWADFLEIRDDRVDVFREVDRQSPRQVNVNHGALENVREWQIGESHIAPGIPFDSFSRGESVAEQVGVGQKDAFRRCSRAGSINDAREIIRAHGSSE